jgi:Glycosyltransferase family 87
VELRAGVRSGLRAAFRGVLLAGLVALAVPGVAGAQDPQLPESQTEPPRFFERSAREAEGIAAQASKVREARRDGPLDPTAYTRGAGRWQVSFFRDGDEVVQVLVEDSSGEVIEQWDGDQVAWRMARGYAGAFGRKLNAPWVWIPLCVLFVLPFLDFRRPFRLLHLDLMVLVGFGLSHVFFNRGEIGVSVPLVYPVLLYLLVRLLLAGFRPRERPGRLVPHVPLAWLAVALVCLVAFRVALNAVDSNVIDVGYAGVIGADRIVDGDELYGEGFSEDVERGDTYGPVSYLLYVPFEQALRWSGGWDDLPAAHAAAIAFDLLAIGGLLLLGRTLRRGREGRSLGLALAWAWAAYPYTAFVLETNANDTLVALACIGALVAFARGWGAAGEGGRGGTLGGRGRGAGVGRRRWAAVGRRRWAAASGAAIGLGAAAKFAPLALAPLFARRSPVVFGAALVVALAVAVLPFVPDGGLREMYDRTIGYQAGRGSPFSLWGQVDSLDWLQTAVKVAAVGLALAVAFVPRRPDARQVAALGAAVLIALQLAVTHWFYLYVVWFVPFVLVTVLGAYREGAPEAEAAPRRKAEAVAA